MKHHNYEYESKIGKRVFWTFVILAYWLINYASNDALIKMTLNLVYDIISVVLPIVPIDQFRNPYTF